MPVELRVQSLNREHPEFLYKSLVAIITLFAKSVNVNIPLTQDQIGMLAADLISDCPDWCIYDFVLFFRGCSKGKYGKINFSIDESKIYELMRGYEEERSIEMEKIMGENKDADKKTLTDAGNFILKNIDKMPGLKEKLQTEKNEYTPGGGIGSRLRGQFDERLPSEPKE